MVAVLANDMTMKPQWLLVARANLKNRKPARTTGKSLVREDQIRSKRLIAGTDIQKLTVNFNTPRHVGYVLTPKLSKLEPTVSKFDLQGSPIEAFIVSARSENHNELKPVPVSYDRIVAIDIGRTGTHILTALDSSGDVRYLELRDRDSSALKKDVIPKSMPQYLTGMRIRERSY